jgi:hypothetical protein
MRFFGHHRGLTKEKTPSRVPLRDKGSGAQIRTEDLQVMRWNPKMGTLDRQALFPRMALRISID